MDLNFVVNKPGAGTKRRTQRRPLACRACTRSKVRCDKTVPCLRCQKRGIICEREDVQLSTKHTRTQDSRSQVLSSKTASEADVGRELDASCNSNLYDSNSQSTTPVNNCITSASPSAPHQANALVHVIPPSWDQNGKQAEFEDLATAVEGLAWGRHQCHRYPHHDCLQVELASSRSGQSNQIYPLPFAHPPVNLARPLISFHMQMLAWTHNVLHVPTFQAQCERFWQSGIVDDVQWLALYYAVLSSSAWTLQNSQISGWTFALPADKDYAKELFNLMMDVLNDSRFMSCHSIFALQATCVSGLVANVLGESDLLTVLVNTSVRIAQCLGLHRIASCESSESPDVRVAKEVGRRVWWKLVEMDHHSMPYTGSCCINLRQFTTQRPLNCEDDDLSSRPESVLTTSSYSLIMVNMALLIPALLDGLWSLEDSTSRYEHVISMDRQMRSLVANIPSAILRSNDAIEYEPKWLPLARRTLAIAAADKVSLSLIIPFAPPLNTVTPHSALCHVNIEWSGLRIQDHNDTPIVPGP